MYTRNGKVFPSKNAERRVFPSLQLTGTNTINHHPRLQSTLPLIHPSKTELIYLPSKSCLSIQSVDH